MSPQQPTVPNSAQAAPPQLCHTLQGFLFLGHCQSPITHPLFLITLHSFSDPSLLLFLKCQPTAVLPQSQFPTDLYFPYLLPTFQLSK